jgi:hypothetical protein
MLNLCNCYHKKENTEMKRRTFQDRWVVCSICFHGKQFAVQQKVKNIHIFTSLHYNGVLQPCWLGAKDGVVSECGGNLLTHC